ncbi:MAG: type IV toxin-antitoxin system AbiEi family antitoxin domain-containing protein [Acidimicrobiia bacterium]
MESSYLALTAKAAARHGAFSKKQATDLGVASRVLSRRVRNGSLVRPYEGVYVVAGSAATGERSVIVAVFSTSADAVASHGTACHLYELARRPCQIEVSVPDGSRPVRSRIIHRSTDLILPTSSSSKAFPAHRRRAHWSTREFRGVSSLPRDAWTKACTGGL